MLGPIFPQLFSGLAGKVRDAHNSILATPPERNGWVAAFAEFEWTVEAGEDLGAASWLRDGEDVAFLGLMRPLVDANTNLVPLRTGTVALVTNEPGPAVRLRAGEKSGYRGGSTCTHDPVVHVRVDAVSARAASAVGAWRTVTIAYGT